ncbi:MAG TPA: malto-oligosyltrehalose synthase, partial [bacterium]|nr:malto-oligosyltrehalose synthase [bacterium]
MHIPTATYRLQFNSSFGFKEAKEIIPYLVSLGISDLYASPIFKARKGSSHGYDIVDPNQLNPELGDRRDFDELMTAVKNYNVKWLQDIVPNHMAFDSENNLLMDVLEHGRKSAYFDFFDIDWDHPYEDIKGRVLAPFLGKVYAECLEDGEIQLHYHQGHLTINYFNLCFPVRIESYVHVFEHNLENLEKKLANDQSLFIKYLGALRYLKAVSASEKVTEYQIKHAKKILWNLYREYSVIEQFVNENINFLNGKKGVQESFNLLDKLISEQFFKLAFWKVASEEINYRRFFAVNDLISLRVENERVFEYTHGLTFQFVAEEKFGGLRVDHIDGLFNPLVYLKRLREKVGDIYIVVEKILDGNEQLPISWPIQGTTGYDFLNVVNGVFCLQEKRSILTKIYENFTGLSIPYDDLLCEKKRMIIGKHFAGNIDNLAHFMKKISARDRYGRDITLYGLRRALVEVMAMFPVYRTYISPESFTESDQMSIKTAIHDAKKKSPGLFYELNFIEKFLLQKYDSSLTEEDKQEWIRFAMYFQQYTAPLMAKAFEDTFFYVYNRLISLNEVGSNPIRFGCSIEEFHNFNQRRVELLPHSMNATSTHDTKRGEDVRARINVLSEIPQEWEENIKSWKKINRHKKRRLGRNYAPDENDEYFLYQTLLGVFPFNNYGEGFTERIQSYIIKAVREAKVHTGWIKPDIEYE